MVPLVALSGTECIEALLAAGFVARSRSEGATTLARGLRRVVIADVPMLSPDELRAVLGDSGISYSDFLDLLSEAPTDPAIALPG